MIILSPKLLLLSPKDHREEVVRYLSVFYMLSISNATTPFLTVVSILAVQLLKLTLF